MVTVLLAIDSDPPDQAVFDFAVQFCRRMQAKLEVVRIIRPQQTTTKRLSPAISPETNSQMEISEPFIYYKQSLRADDPDKAIARYVRAHRNVVLTIYDTHRRKSTLLKKQKSLQLQTNYPLVVPLVVARRGPL